MAADVGPRQSPERLIHAAEVATRLGVDIATLQRWYDHDNGPPVALTFAGRLLYWYSDFENWQDGLGGLAGAWG
jgi:hypothetical protein